MKTLDAAPLPPAQKKKLAEQIRDTLEEEIVTHKLLPGDRLDENGLAKRFGVSRTPIREALTQMVSMGLLEIRPRRGVVVRTLSMETLLAMFEVMGELEALAGRFAARRMSEDERARLVEAHEQCSAAVQSADPDSYYYRNEVFHRLIYVGSHNGFLEEQATMLHRQLRPYRRLQLRVRHRMLTSFKEHQAIVEAILAGDPGRAADAMRSHVVIQGERFGDMIASLHEIQPGRRVG